MRFICFAALAAIPLLAADATKISGPYTHENLAIYLVHDPSLVHGQSRTTRTYMTLQEAMEQRKVIVYETSDVNTLEIANVSRDIDVYIQSGDIVKGGKQDRVIKDDIILQSMSGKTPLRVFCVEQGRWTQRGSESAGQFESSRQSIAGKKMKMAVRSDADQHAVWDRVAEVQRDLSKNLNAPVQSAESRSSFQLTLETKKVRETTQGFERALEPLLAKNPDAVGYIAAVNGKVTGADVYASHALFAKLWPKLLASAAVEAMQSERAAVAPAAPTMDAVKSVLAPADDEKAGPATKVNARTEVQKKESKAGVQFETKDAALPGGFVHRSYVAK